MKDKCDFSNDYLDPNRLCKDHGRIFAVLHEFWGDTFDLWEEDCNLKEYYEMLCQKQERIIRMLKQDNQRLRDELMAIVNENEQLREGQYYNIITEDLRDIHERLLTIMRRRRDLEIENERSDMVYEEINLE